MPSRRGAADFPDRARWLQEIRKSGDLGGLYADMVRDVLRNIEETFAAYLNRGPESRRRGDLGSAAGLSRLGSVSTTLSRGISPISLQRA